MTDLAGPSDPRSTAGGAVELLAEDVGVAPVSSIMCTSTHRIDGADRRPGTWGAGRDRSVQASMTWFARRTVSR